MIFSWYVALRCSLCHRVNGTLIDGYLGEEKMIGCSQCGTGIKVNLPNSPTSISVGHLDIDLGIYDPTNWVC